MEIDESDVVNAVAISFGASLGKMLAADGRGLLYRKETAWWLLGRLRGEVEELANAIEEGPPIAACKECLDVAAFAMMLWDVQGR